MTYTSSIDTTPADATRLRQRLLPAALVTALVTVGFNALGTVASGPSSDGEHGWREFLIVSGVTVVAVAVVFGLVVARGLRRESAGGTALALSVLGLLLIVPAFWSGVVPALAVGGTMLGWAGRHGTRRSGLSQAAVVVGLLVLVGYVAIYVLDALHTHGIG